MKKLIEREASYYRVNLGGGNLIYLSHAKQVNKEDYIDLTIKDILAKIDEAVEGFNALSSAIQNITSMTDVAKLKEEMKLLDTKLIKIGDYVNKMIASQDATPTT